MELSGAFATSLSRRPLPELIAERIVAAIAAGVLTPGDRLPSEPQLAKQMSVGRGSLREALAKLQDAGVVEIVRGRGAFVREPAGDDSRLRFAVWSRSESSEVTQLLEARIGLESTAAGLACDRADPGDLEALGVACDEHEKAHRSGDLTAMVDTDERFHTALVDCAHNAVITDLYRTLVPGLKEFRQQLLSREGAERRSTHDHARIVAAVADKDHSAARRGVVAHLWPMYAEVVAAATGGDGVADYDGAEIFVD
ncbi:GntR family transcriptional repressor for pyruvate dehydrogenase complex [Nocardia transvalensis]|uniref:GntR family transcriptional repressor for pyruvate dehydrogenase complex n=1 Tax=Nocardia transvalensis TaxID=37333 RepID=A0A7W9UJP6_9NOCA|nr:FadR/GntR family transcriptional regulator [Nocardia transvalensis]MBB5915678.1 GntR family transcriptional repressor for pyruvate dehydrogenase complex [Nocardia transvalensis]